MLAVAAVFLAGCARREAKTLTLTLILTLSLTLTPTLTRSLTLNLIPIPTLPLTLSLTRREAKTLEATREAGPPVELWKVRSEKHQAAAVVEEMARRHRDAGVPWGEMAVLLRCFKTERGTLHGVLQEALTTARVPYCVVGGKTFFERRSVLDTMAYLRLALLGGGERDDDAFAQVLTPTLTQTRTQTRTQPQPQP